MCIESKAAEGDTHSFTGTWNAYSAIVRYETVYSSCHRTFYLEATKDFFVVGHTYHVSGWVMSGVVSTSTSFNSTLSSCDVYFASGDSEIFLTGSKAAYYAKVDFDFYYFGQDVGINIYSNLSPVSGNNTAFTAYGYAKFHDDYPLVFTDLGVVSRDSDILKQIDKSTQHTEQIMGEVNETSKGIFGAIKDFFGSFFQNLIDSVIGLFVPSTDEMSDLLGQLNDFFSDTFGFLYAPFDYLIQLVGVFTSSTGGTGLTLPRFSILGQEVWGDQTYDIASDPVAGKVLEYVRIGTGVLLGGWFIMYLQDFFKERFGKG